jgi:pimeloyl-ACP methyl ester carboxylesterase
MYPDDMAGLILEETQHEDNFSEMKKILKGKDLEMFEQVLVPGFAAPENPKSERDYRDATREQLKTSQALPRMPFVVLTVRDRAYAMRPIFSEGALAELARLDEELMNRLAASLPGGKHVMIEGTGHYVHVDKPALLIAPVLEMIQALREKNMSDAGTAPGNGLAAAADLYPLSFRSSQARFTPRVRMVPKPSSSFSTSPFFRPLPMFQ